MAKNSKPDLRDRTGRGTVNTETEAHVVGAKQRPVPESDYHILRPEPGNNVPDGQTTKG